MENDLEFCITIMFYRIVLVITNISTLCVIFMIKTYSKSKIDTRNEISDLKLRQKGFGPWVGQVFQLWPKIFILNIKMTCIF